MPGAPVRSVALRGEGLGPVAYELVELALDDHRIDEAPLDGLFTPHALGLRAERVGAIAAHLALVGQSREATGAGEHAEQRHFGK